MKKAYLPPLAVLAVILAFAVWNSLSMSEDTSRWRDQLQCADAQAQAGNWPAATAELVDSYKDWSAHQTYLHIVSEHEAVDDAETMYRRAMAFAETQEITEFRAELSDLMDQLRLISEMEALNIRNVL